MTNSRDKTWVTVNADQATLSRSHAPPATVVLLRERIRTVTSVVLVLRPRPATFRPTHRILVVLRRPDESRRVRRFEVGRLGLAKTVMSAKHDFECCH